MSRLSRGEKFLGAEVDRGEAHDGAFVDVPLPVVAQLAFQILQRRHWRERGCLRCLLLVMCTYPFAKKALTFHLARGEGHERYFGCNLMQRKVLASSYQHLMTEAPLYR